MKVDGDPSDYNSDVRFKKSFFCAAFLYYFYNYALFVTPRAGSFKCCLAVIEINTGIDITAFKGNSYEVFLLHTSDPGWFTILIT